MKNIILAIILFCCAAMYSEGYQAPENYYFGCEELDGNELKQQLHEIIKGHEVFPYFSDEQTATKDILMDVDQDPDNPDHVICFYSGFSYPKNWIDIGRNEDYSSYGTTIDNTWNREHVWSKSHGFPDRKKDIAYTDVHNLRPEDRTVNSAKGAKDFDWGGFGFDEVNNCFTDTDSWQPPDRVKGDVARCLFYMAVRYEGTDTPYDLELVDNVNTEGEEYGRLSTLLEWHEMDPPDEYEMRRNHLIFSRYQHNRNPFIDHPEFANVIWGKPQYSARLNLSEQDLHFSAVQNTEKSIQTVNITAVNLNEELNSVIRESPVFSIVSEKLLIQENGLLNYNLSIGFDPAEAGSHNCEILIPPFEETIDLKAEVLPENGNWLINEDFEESLGEFTSRVISGNPRYGWYHSSWDDNHFAMLRGSRDDFDLREVWLYSSNLNLADYSEILLNFENARNHNKSEGQLQVYITWDIDDEKFPEEVYKLEASLSEGNYNWENSGWIKIKAKDFDFDSPCHLLFRYHYPAGNYGQETWEIDDLKFYGVNK